MPDVSVTNETFILSAHHILKIQ